MRIIVLISFLIVLGLLFSAIQVPTIDRTKHIEPAIKEAISESNVSPADENIVEHAVVLSVEKLEASQRTRLKYLVSAYLIIWLVFMLYLLRLGKQQQTLDKRLAQLEQETAGSEEDTAA